MRKGCVNAPKQSARSPNKAETITCDIDGMRQGRTAFHAPPMGWLGVHAVEHNEVNTLLPPRELVNNLSARPGVAGG